MFAAQSSDAPPWWSALRQKNIRPWLAVWVLLFGGGVVGAWTIALHMAEGRREAAAALIQQEAQARVRSYGRQLEELTGRLDQVGKLLMSEWATHPKAIDFGKILAGVSPTGTPLYSAVFDTEGRIGASSFVPQSRTVGRTGFIEHHRLNCCDGWYVTPVEFSPTVGRDLMRVTHRLSRADGSFAGALAFGIPVNLLAAFQDDSTLGPRDFVTVRLLDGPVLTTKLGAGQPPRIFYKQSPKFPTSQGVRRESGDLFRDGMARYVAWRQHPSLPLVALAAIAEADAMGEVEDTVTAYYATAGLLSLILLLVGGGGIVVAGKILARRAVEEEVRQVYRTATDAANEGFYMLRPLWDGDGPLSDLLFEDVNWRGGMLLGRDRRDLLGQRARAVLPPEAFDELLELTRKALSFQVAEDERRVPAAARLPAKWLYRRAVKVGGGVALTLRDISEGKAHEEALVELAHRDVLTGLPNRLWLHRYLPTAVRRARRSHRQMAVMFLDLDHFKTVNDTLGHDAGDELLKEVTAQLRATVRSSDHIVRLGGDEFLVVIENADDRASVELVARKIIDALTAAFTPRDGAISKVSASIGMTLFPDDGQLPEELLKHADIAMYESKTLGRGKACWYTRELSEQLAERLGSEQALRKALERDELIVCFQPKFFTHSGQLSGLEALVRWQRPERGLVMPSSFIALAENTGLIVPLGERVIALVAAQMARWQGAGLPVPRVAINVSPEQLRRSDVAAYLDEQLRAAGVAANLIDIEITESAMVEQSEDVQRQLLQLRALGVGLVIDDFGAGYSSLSQLQQLDVDGLKMDRGLVAPLVQGSDAEALCRAIVSMAVALDLKVVAEGVETVEQINVLRNIGCDELQGFLLAEPMTATDTEALLRQPAARQLGAFYGLARKLQAGESPAV